MKITFLAIKSGHYLMLDPSWLPALRAGRERVAL